MAPFSSQSKQTTLDTGSGTLKRASSQHTATSSTGKTATGKLRAVQKRSAVSASKSQPEKQTSPTGGKHHDVRQGSAHNSPIRSTGGIQSFFDKTAQKLPQSSLPQQRLPSPTEFVETITSDEDESGFVALSKGSSTALALRKRRFQPGHPAERTSGQDNSSLSVSQKFRKLDDGRRVVSSPASGKDGRPWTDRFGPTSIEELAVHKRKVDDVRSWLENAIRGRRNKALIIKGPAGAGKTTTVKLLANSLGLDAVEWISPAGREYGEAATSYAAQFEEFMLRSGRSTGLVFSKDDEIPNNTAPTKEERNLDPQKKHFLLVEEFPNTYSTASNAVQSFRSTIAQHLALPPPIGASPIPVVFVISETSLSTSTAAADSFTTHRLLGPELSMHAFIDTIEFNPIAPTFLLKALDQTIVKEARISGRRFVPGKAVLKRLAEFGDIRSAISTLEFLLSRDGEHIWSGKVSFTKPKKRFEPELTSEEQEAVRWISSRASSLDIFHSVGKVVYNKRLESSTTSKAVEPPPWLPQHRRPQVPENDVNDLVTEIGTETSTFIAALHENYLLSCSNAITETALDSVNGCIDNLSDSDLLCIDRFSTRNQYSSGTAADTLRQDEIAFQLGVRGVLFNLPSNVKRTASVTGEKRDAFRMYYPASAKLWRHQAETESALESVLLALQSLRPPLPVIDAVRERLYMSAGVRPHAEVSGETDEHRSSKTSLLRMPKTGLLLECLSYVYSVVQVRDSSAPLLGQLRKVIKMAGFADSSDTDEDTEDSQHTAARSMTDQWATDKPEEAGRMSIKRVPRVDPLLKAVLPVEKTVASLVLEDDDIED